MQWRFENSKQLKMKPHEVAACLTLLIAAMCLSSGKGQNMNIDPVDLDGYRLDSDPTYMIVAPKRIYPNMVVQISVSVFKLYYSHMNVRASIRKDGEEFASFFETFTMPSTRLLQMQLMDNIRPGNYSLRVEGTLNGGQSGNIFQNETRLIFDEKQVSMFITVSKPVYMQGQEVMFRIVPVKPNLLPIHGAMDVFVVDPTDTVVRRWLAMQTNLGVLDMKMRLSDQPTYGEWKIRVKGFGTTYHQSFHVEEFYRPRFYVNVSMPMYIFENSFGLAGVITANLTSGRPVRGSGMLHLEIRPPLQHIIDGNYSKTPQWPSIDRELYFFEGTTDFLFTMDELTRVNGGAPLDKEIHVNVTLLDWFQMQNQTGSGICIIKSDKVTMKLLGDPSRAFKPGFPISVYYAVVNTDGSPLYGSRRQVGIQETTVSTSGSTKRKEEQKFIVPDDGIVQYTFVPDANADLIKISAWYDEQGRGQQVDCALSRTYTINGHYLQISTSTLKPEVNKYMVFTLRTTIFVPEVYYMIVAGGNIVVVNRLDMQARQKTFSVALSRDMVPSARILAYYVYNREIVTDSLNFFVNGTRQNTVEVKVNMGKDFSRDTVEISGRTDPGSFIAFSGVDYDWWAYGGNIFLRENDIIEELETYDSHANMSYMHTWYYGEEVYQKVYYPAPTYATDANMTFTYAGLHVFTDANLTRIPHYCNESRGYLPCNDMGCYEFEQRCDGQWQCQDGVDEMGCERYKEKDPFTPPIQRFKHLTRHYEEDGSWLWTGTFVKPDGRIDLKRKVPKEPMPWVIGALSMSIDKGLGVVTEPARYQSTRPFYIQVEMPETAIKGEMIGVRVALFNYWDTDLECLVTLHDSDDYRFVVVPSHGLVSSYKPKTARGDVQTMVYVQKDRMMTIYMPVLPVVDKDVTVTVSATSFMGQDRVSRVIHISYDGVTNFYHTPYLVDLINQGSKIIPDFEIVVPERFIAPEQREHLYVPGSPTARVSVVGDMVGPGFFQPSLNATNFMNKPYGAGENAAFNFAINLYYLQYLKITNQLNDTVLQSGLDYMNVALQRVLSYMNKDGSFSQFRDYHDHKPSTWLTSLVLEILQDSDEADWHLAFYMEPELLNRIAAWLCEQQGPDGAFIERGPIYDYKMKSNETTKNGESHYNNVTLTAHVLIALSKAATVSGDARVCVDTAKKNAIDYLETFLSELKDPFQTSIVAYALAIANSNKRNDAFYRLQAMQLQNEFTYWSNEPIPVNPTKIVNTVHFMLPRLIYPNEGYAVQTTSYALMLYLNNNFLQDALPIMKWLQTMRNSLGGFGGTRDTLVALQALCEYGKRDTNRDLYNMQIDLESTSTHGWRRNVRLNRENWVNTQFIDIPQIWGQVKAVAQGTGIALMQLEVTKNVEYPRQIEPVPQGEFFTVDLKQVRFYGKNMSIGEYELCTRWLKPEPHVNDDTGMVVMEVRIPTGYVVTNDVLRQYAQSGEVPNLGRAESRGNKVHFYFDYVENRRDTCVKFRIDRWFPAANMTIQHSIKVYDYYEPGRFNHTLYTTFGLFNLHICQVCGSFQCPYCPFYNTAGPQHISVLLSLITALAAMALSHWLIGR